MDQLIENIKAFFQLFGATVPSWLWDVVALIVALYLLSKIISFSLSFLNTVKNEWSQLRNPEQKRRLLRRQNFAEHIEYTIRQLDLKEDWKDKRFAELEAEIEAEGRYRVASLLPFSRTKSGLRRESSLSKALASSRDRLILLEGEPGSGKSIALRYVVSVIAKEAQRSHDLKSAIPIYVNLKELDPAVGTAIDRNLIESFVLGSLKRTNDRDIDQFLDDGFQQGIRDGAWFFIFDSFDELPAILSSTEVDHLVRSYGDAIDDFLHGMNSRCRGIVASRQFRGPAYLKGLGWSTFRILPLSEERGRQLIQRADLAPKLMSELVGQLGNATVDIRSMASNPLFLALLCEYMKSGKPFPSNTHVVFETYIQNRLTRDQARLQRRFNLDTTQVRATAEQIAFCMTADSGIGLNPTRGNLQDALVRQQMTVPNNFHALLDALEFIKLARSDETAATGPARPFTFAHRRFQEYFATCVVLRETARVTPKELLMNARWRETTVVLCQTQPTDKLSPLLDQAKQFLVQFGSALPDLINDPLDYVRKQEQATLNKQPVKQSSWRRDQEQQTLREFFPWPSSLSHLLSILQEGFLSRLTDVPETIRTLIGSLVLSATEERPLYDRKWALEVAGAASELVLVYLLNQAFAHSSEGLKEMAYRQTMYLSTLPSTIARTICRALIGLALSRRLRRDRYTTQAYIARLPKSSVDFLAIMQLLIWLPLIDFILLIILVVCDLPAMIQYAGINPNFHFIFFITLFMGLAGYLIWNNPPLRPINTIYNVHRSVSYLSYRSISQLFDMIIMRFVSWPLFALMPFALPGNVWRPDGVIIALIGMQAVSLAPLALVAVETGTIIFSPIRSWLPWILIPFWQIIWLMSYLFRRLPSLALSFFLSLSFFFCKKTYKLFIKVFVVTTICLVLLGIGVLLLYLLSFPISYISNSIILVLRSVFFILLTIIVGLVDIGFAMLIIRFVYRSIRQSRMGTVEVRQHRRLWEAFLRDIPGETSCQDWWKAMGKYHAYTFISEKKAIRSTREKCLLTATEETENFIKFLAAQTEANLQNMIYTGSLNPGIAALDIQNAHYQQFLENANAGVLDELYLLLEDVHSRRLGATYD